MDAFDQLLILLVVKIPFLLLFSTIHSWTLILFVGVLSAYFFVVRKKDSRKLKEVVNKTAFLSWQIAVMTSACSDLKALSQRVSLFYLLALPVCWLSLMSNVKYCHMFYTHCCVWYLTSSSRHILLTPTHQLTKNSLPVIFTIIIIISLVLLVILGYACSHLLSWHSRGFFCTFHVSCAYMPRHVSCTTHIILNYRQI